ncbi:uncharacterized protein V6R79_006733 [Siganus canaliculatus]
MSRALLFVLGLFFLNPVPCRLAQETKPQPTLSADSSIRPPGGAVTLTCSVQDSDDWRYVLYRETSPNYVKLFTGHRIQVSEGGVYYCKGEKNGIYTEESDKFTVVEPAPVLTFEPSWSQMFRGETVTFHCQVQEGGDTRWTYEWTKNNNMWGTNSINRVNETVYQSGEYRCRRKSVSSSTVWSDPITLTVSGTKPQPTLSADSSIRPPGGAVTLTCSVQDSDSWRYELYREGSSSTYKDSEDFTGPSVQVSEAGVYWCLGVRGEISTQLSDKFTVVKPGPVLTFEPSWSLMFRGETVTFHCQVQERGDTRWTYEWTINNNRWGTTSVNSVSDTVYQSGEYSCRGRKDPDLVTEWSNIKTLTASQTKPQPTLSADSSIRPPGGAVTLTCSVQDSDGWRYVLYREIRSSPYYYKDFTGHSVQVSETGVYWCLGVRGNPVISTEQSNKFTVLERGPVLTFEPSWSLMFRGETVTFHCQVQEGGDTRWTYEWTKNNNSWRTTSVNRVSDRVYQSGEYRCRRTSGSSSTVWSDPITLTVSETKPQPTLSADSSIRPPGGAVTLTCSVQDSDGWRYELYREISSSPYKVSKDFTGPSVHVSEGGVYYCRGVRGVIYTEQSNKFTVLERAPVLTFEPSWSRIFTGERVEFTCSIQGSGVSRWTYEWSPATLNPAPVSSSQSRTITATEPDSGDYSCRGRKDPDLVTKWSNIITLTVSRHRPKAQLSAESRDLPVGGSVTLTCSVEPPSSGWRFFWFRGDKNSELLKTPMSDGPISVSEEGVYWCRGGRGRGRGRASYVYYTEYSEGITINKPKPVLTVSPSWLSPGDSLTLTCEVQRPPAGWSFFWFKAVPKLSDDLYSYEPISDSSSGTEQDFYTVHGQSHTAGYMCRAGRGTPVYSTHDSEVKFVWSGDVQSSVSLTVSPPTVQHFTSDPVSVKCEGNSTRWRVMRFDPVNKRLTSCSSWGRMTGPECNMNPGQHSDATVYWCESGSGEFSNAVNITTHKTNIILRSPVHPVIEGDPVSLSCRLKNNKFVSNVIFYQNDKVVQNDTSREFNISAVSRSHEGFYKCRHLNEESAQSWMSVKDSDSSASFPVWVIVVVVCGIVVIILLLLLYRCRASNRSCCVRSVHTESTNKSSHTNHVVNQNETRQDEPQDVTYSLIELKNIKKNGNRDKAEESCVYSEVNTGAEDDVTYAQINRLNVGKGKRKEDAKLTLEPTWSTFYPGESVTFTCEVDEGNGGNVGGWNFTFTRDAQRLASCSSTKSCSVKLSRNCSGEYQCTAHHMNTSSTVKSQSVSVAVSEPIRPSLSVSPSWLTPGGSVTLKCELAPSAGWSFYWYKVFPKPLNNSYSYELMSHSSGTKQDSYVVHDQTQTSAYTCRAGRGKPVVYTQQSKRCYVWSGDVHRVSLRVSPNSEQHFPSDPVSLTCEGNAAPWRLMRVTETGWVSNSSVWGKGTGSWYLIQNFTYKQAVYWCETTSGLFSNAVNISASKKDLILTGPALPVRVGDSVRLGCKLKTGSFTSDVTFYRNGDLVQTDARAELRISAASESDEGYYMCEYAGGVSLQSWLSVRATSFGQKTSSFALELIVCVIVGASVIIFPLLFCCCRKSKDSYSDRNQQHQVTFTSSDGDEIIYQNDLHPEEASSQLPGEACLYESITLPRNRRHDERSIATYTLIHLPNVMSSVGQRHGSLEDPAYINVTFRSAAGAAAP